MDQETPSTTRRLLLPILRTAIVATAVLLVWIVAGNWNRWTGQARLQTSDDAYVAGDLTPLSAKVAGYIKTVEVDDFQAVKQGDLIATIDPSDYQAALDLAQAGLAGTQADLAALATQRDVQRAQVRQAEATIAAARADLTRYQLEAARQRDLFKTRIAGTEQRVEQADDEAQRAAAQLQLNQAQLDQQRALLAGLDIKARQLTAQVQAAQAQADQARLNLSYTRITAPADGMVGLRRVRPGQFVNIGTQVIAVMSLPNVWVVANYKETQMTNVRAGDAVDVTVDAFPALRLHGRVESWSPGTGSVFALLPPDNATGNFTKVVQRVPVKIVLDPIPELGRLVRPGMSVETTIATRGDGS